MTKKPKKTDEEKTDQKAKPFDEIVGALLQVPVEKNATKAKKPKKKK